MVARIPERLDDDADHLTRAGVDEARAGCSYFDGDTQASLDSFDRAVAGYERARAWPKFGAALGTKINLLGVLGRHREAWLLLRGRHAVATEEDDLREMASALGSLGLWCDEQTEALDYLMQAAARRSPRRLRRAGVSLPGQRAGGCGRDRRLGHRRRDHPGSARAGGPP